MQKYTIYQCINFHLVSEGLQGTHMDALSLFNSKLMILTQRGGLWIFLEILGLCEPREVDDFCNRYNSKKFPFIFLKSLLVVVFKVPKNPYFVAFSENLKYTYLPPTVQCLQLLYAGQAISKVNCPQFLQKTNKTRLKVNPKLLANRFFLDHIFLKTMFVSTMFF